MSRTEAAETPLPRNEKANARRSQVIQAARTLFAEAGFHNTGMAQISKASGVLVGQIYRDFANKEAIVAAMVEQDLDEFLYDGVLCNACSTGDHAAVRVWIADFVACEEVDDARIFAEITAEAARNERIAAIFHMIDQRLRQQLILALRIIAAADVDEDRLVTVANLILTVSWGVMQRRVLWPGQVDRAVFAPLLACIDAQVDALCGDPVEQAACA
ncbi:TetR/AcrR family transcriptional regulator [Sphingomonas sp. Mn802worker]|uniref:TetR/AcrR family transcriptional regulator n=1 Tax=Sphingomonas sp. Mn802worker TaxID=629773 RepID=UPI0003A31010|nr:TetR/AcrR family transcriptional regulator [Sphingomonas sp. Mn802worker]